MSKQGVYKISGNTQPKVGETVTYTIDEWYPATPKEKRNPALVTWHLFKKVDGKFVPTNIKKKGISSFTFQNTAYQNTYRIEAYLHEPEGKAPMAIEVQPQQSEVPKINGIQLKYANNTSGNVFNFTEKLIAEAQCTGLEGKYLTFTLWEDDAKDSGHDAKNLQIDSKKEKVISGAAKAQFILTSALMKKAIQGETDVKQLEFYVTVEYYENKKHASDNVNINTPQGIYIPPKKPQPKPEPPTSQPKAEGSPAAQKGQSQKEKKGIIETTTETISGVVSEIGKKIYDWAEAKGTVKKDQKPAPPPTSGETPTVVKDLPSKEKKDEKGICFCDRDFTSAEFEKIIHSLRDSESRVKKDSGYALFAADNCNLKSEDKTIEKLKNQINSIFARYGINTCIRKLHFLAQIYHETDRLRTTLEYATNKEYKPYFGRGLMQLTWEKNYKIYGAYSGVECVNNYKIISENLYYACDSAGWYWKQGKVLSVGERWKGPSDPPIYVKNQNPNYPKTTITWKDGNITKKYGTLDLGLIADDDKVDLISYLINGGANGLQERRNYVLTLKSIFKYPQECINKKTSSTVTNPTNSDTVTIRLVRKWQTNKSTIGEFTIDNTDIKGYFLEEKGPDTTVSGIEQRVPIGTYNLEWHSGSKIKKGLKLYNDVVSKSRAILIHSGNTADDTEGCLIAGSTRAKDYVGGSRNKLKEIFDHVEEIGIKGSKIIITQAYE